MYCAMSERRNHQPSQNVSTASNFDTYNKISATYSVLSHSLTTNLKTLPFYTLSKKQRTKWDNFLQWRDTSTNIFTIKCTGYHHLKQKLSKFSQFHAPQLLKKAEAFGLCHLQLNSSYPLLKNIFYMLELLWKLAEFRYCKPNTAISL